MGASTNTDGSFSLQVPPPSADAVLEINYLGYEPIAQTVGSRTNITFTLRESAVDVDAVVVTALGIKRSEKALSYNVQQVNSEDIVANKDVNFINSLSGKVAGVTINSSSGTVRPLRHSTVRMPPTVPSSSRPSAARRATLR